MSREDERFWAKVELSPNGCWHWTAAKIKGYGSFAAEGRRTVVAHRWSYTRLVGPVPTGLQLDHTCHNTDPNCMGGATCLHRSCVNPAHLEPVTPSVNLLRSPHTVNRLTSECPRGHEVNEENCGWTRGSRYCRVCRREKHRASKAARLANAGG